MVAVGRGVLSRDRAGVLLGRRWTRIRREMKAIEVFNTRFSFFVDISVLLTSFVKSVLVFVSIFRLDYSTALEGFL